MLGKKDKDEKAVQFSLIFYFKKTFYMKRVTKKNSIFLLSVNIWAPVDGMCFFSL